MPEHGGVWTFDLDLKLTEMVISSTRMVKVPN
jgi:hypothetical protein